MNNSQISPKLIPVKKIDAHIDALYVILKNRKFNISNNSLPSFNEHKLFIGFSSAYWFNHDGEHLRVIDDNWNTYERR